jgi:hypothetical protein
MALFDEVTWRVRVAVSIDLSNSTVMTMKSFMEKFHLI